MQNLCNLNLQIWIRIIVYSKIFSWLGLCECSLISSVCVMSYVVYGCAIQSDSGVYSELLIMRDYRARLHTSPRWMDMALRDRDEEERIR